MKQEVYDILKKIPKGYVVTYGDIAQALGNKKLSRVVGNILHNNPDPIGQPCYKVVNSKGKLSTHYAYGGLDAQKELLEKDGINVEDDTVDLKKYRFHLK